MPFRSQIVLLLLLSLLFTTQAPVATARPTDATMPGCAMTTCMTGCCAQMACCARSADDRPAQDQAPAPPGTDLEFAALGLHAFSILYALPASPLRPASREQEQGAHTLPRLAATCIRLI